MADIGRVLDLISRGAKLKPHQRHCVQDERLLSGRKESNQTNKTVFKRGQVEASPEALCCVRFDLEQDYNINIFTG